MQTFLPYSDFYLSAVCLDNKRLGKQRVETLQIMSVLTGLRLISTRKDPDGKTIQLDRDEWTTEPLTKKGWANHPAVKMWRGYEYYLFMYQQAVCNTWTSRAFKDTCLDKTSFLYSAWRRSNPAAVEKPPWLADAALHLSHKSNLVRKLPEHYGLLWPDVPGNLEYLWPVD